MTVERSKRRCFLTLTFIVKSVSKNLLIQIFLRSVFFFQLIVFAAKLMLIWLIGFPQKKVSMYTQYPSIQYPEKKRALKDQNWKTPLCMLKFSQLRLKKYT